MIKNKHPHLFLVRHTQTVENIKGIYQGQTVGGMLSAEGKKQAMKIADFLKEEEIDIVYCSPLKRAKDTAEVILKNHLGAKLTEVVELVEINGGEFEGKTTAQFHQARQDWKKNFFDFKPKNGESLLEVYKRVSNFFKGCIKKNQSILIVTHHTTLIVITIYLLGMQLTKPNYKKIDEDSKSAIYDFSITFKGDKFKVKSFRKIKYG